MLWVGGEVRGLMSGSTPSTRLVALLLEQTKIIVTISAKRKLLLLMSVIENGKEVGLKALP